MIHNRGVFSVHSGTGLLKGTHKPPSFWRHDAQKVKNVPVLAKQKTLQFGRDLSLQVWWQKQIEIVIYLKAFLAEEWTWAVRLENLLNFSHKLNHFRLNFIPKQIAVTFSREKKQLACI